MAISQLPRAFTLDPLILLVPGHNDQTSRDWLARWERSLPFSEKLEFGSWDKPHRNTWVNKLNLALYRANRKVVIIAEGLACLAVAWWAEYEAPPPGGPLRAAVLIDPPNVERPGGDARLAAFPSYPRSPMPFATCVLASKLRSLPEIRNLRQLARDWHATIDTIAENAILDVPASGPVQSLGQRFLSAALAPARAY